MNVLCFGVPCCPCNLLCTHMSIIDF